MTSTSETQTYEIARLAWEQVAADFGQKAIIFALTGPLGAGKTRFVKGLALAMGVYDNIVSPTYVLETEYDIPKSPIKFVHLDAYRTETADELMRLGFDRRIKSKAVICLEWSDKFPTFLSQFADKAKIVEVDLKPLSEENSREITWKIL